MSMEYHTGYCKSCDADRKLERKTPNHILHFSITVLLGIFTYGIGSALWIVVWFLISTKFSGWTCHVCGSKNDEPVFHHTEHNSKNQEKKVHKTETKYDLSLLKSPKIISGIVLSFIVIIFLFTFDMSENNGNNEKEEKKSKENVVNATIDVQEQADKKKESILKLKTVESDLCYLYDIKHKENTISGSVSCKEGKLNINLYDRESKSIVDTKVVMFKDNKFKLKLDNSDNIDFKFEVKLTKKQIAERKKQLKEVNGNNIQSVNSDGNEKNNTTNECSIKEWNHSKYSKEYLVVDGKTTCKKGSIVLEIYDENNNILGKELDSIEFGVFSIFFKTNANPTNITLKYVITLK